MEPVIYFKSHLKKPIYPDGHDEPSKITEPRLLELKCIIPGTENEIILGKDGSITLDPSGPLYSEFNKIWGPKKGEDRRTRTYQKREPIKIKPLRHIQTELDCRRRAPKPRI